jgi:hypothetical protein
MFAVRGGSQSNKMLFENLFGNKSQLPGTGGGNFERHRNLLNDKGAFGPLGVSLPEVQNFSKSMNLNLWMSRLFVVDLGRMN